MALAIELFIIIFSTMIIFVLFLFSGVASEAVKDRILRRMPQRKTKKATGNVSAAAHIVLDLTDHSELKRGI